MQCKLKPAFCVSFQSEEVHGHFNIFFSIFSIQHIRILKKTQLAQALGKWKCFFKLQVTLRKAKTCSKLVSWIINDDY